MDPAPGVPRGHWVPGFKRPVVWRSCGWGLEPHCGAHLPAPQLSSHGMCQASGCLGFPVRDMGTVPASPASGSYEDGCGACVVFLAPSPLERKGSPQEAVVVGFSREGWRCSELCLGQELISVRGETRGFHVQTRGRADSGLLFRALSLLSYPPETGRSQFADKHVQTLSTHRPSAHTALLSALVREVVSWTHS